MAENIPDKIIALTPSGSLLSEIGRGLVFIIRTQQLNVIAQLSVSVDTSVSTALAYLKHLSHVPIAKKRRRQVRYDIFDIFYYGKIIKSPRKRFCTLRYYPWRTEGDPLEVISQMRVFLPDVLVAKSGKRRSVTVTDNADAAWAAARENALYFAFDAFPRA